MKRSFFFLQDSVTGQFYTGQVCFRGGFSDAAVYYSADAANKKAKAIKKSWEHAEKFADYHVKQAAATGNQESITWAADYINDVVIRKDLPNWGVTVVEASVEL